MSQKEPRICGKKIKFPHFDYSMFINLNFLGSQRIHILVRNLIWCWACLWFRDLATAFSWYLVIYSSSHSHKNTGLLCDRSAVASCTDMTRCSHNNTGVQWGFTSLHRCKLAAKCWWSSLYRYFRWKRQDWNVFQGI